ELGGAAVRKAFDARQRNAEKDGLQHHLVEARLAESPRRERIVARDGFEDAARVGTAARLRHLHVVRRTRKKLERPENALLLPDFAALEQVEHGLRPLRLGQGRKRALEERRAGEVYEGQMRAKSGSER